MHPRGSSMDPRVPPVGFSSDNECKSSPEFLCISLFDFCQGSTADCSRTPAKLQQSSKKTTSDIEAPNPAGVLDCFLVVHALGAVCLHPAQEAKKKSPVGRQNLPPANAGTKPLLHQSSGSLLIVTSVVPGAQVLDPSNHDSPVVHLSKFGGETKPALGGGASHLPPAGTVTPSSELQRLKLRVTMPQGTPASGDARLLDPAPTFGGKSRRDNEKNKEESLASQDSP
ncbi:hypothetical protein NDU88_000623 [Pleurodeles waltl]|uniref:Uncharacterized protein n=1 Tax=Pleurodeles waltl TaxID=8319 RepID=A0AAV7WIN2_PLEWA|nr:hypothetical protein NDU88_000623 [Pleurodeles waltl]